MKQGCVSSIEFPAHALALVPLSWGISWRLLDQVTSRSAVVRSLVQPVTGRAFMCPRRRAARDRSTRYNGHSSRPAAVLCSRTRGGQPVAFSLRREYWPLCFVRLQLSSAVVSLAPASACAVCSASVSCQEVRCVSLMDLASSVPMLPQRRHDRVRTLTAQHGVAALLEHMALTAPWSTRLTAVVQMRQGECQLMCA